MRSRSEGGAENDEVGDSEQGGGESAGPDAAVDGSVGGFEVGVADDVADVEGAEHLA